MHSESLVRMANQIGSFFQAMPDHAEAVEGVAQHIRKFWDPRMRRALLSHVDSGEGEALNAMAAEAVRVHRAMLTPAPAAPSLLTPPERSPGA